LDWIGLGSHQGLFCHHYLCTLGQKYTVGLAVFHKRGGIGVVSYWWCPLDFQLFNFSGHFRAAQTLNIQLHAVACPVTTALSLFLHEAHNIFCVTLKLFSVSFVPLFAPNPGDATASDHLIFGEH